MAITAKTKKVKKANGATPARAKKARKPLTVGDLMSPAAHTIGKDQPLAVAHEMMRKHHIRHLPVLDGGKLVGVVSDRDLYLIESLKDVDPEEVLVEEAMTAEAYATKKSEPIEAVAKVMAEHRYGSAIVMEKGTVIGVFTTTDALRALFDLR